LRSFLSTSSLGGANARIEVALPDIRYRANGLCRRGIPTPMGDPLGALTIEGTDWRVGGSFDSGRRVTDWSEVHLRTRDSGFVMPLDSL